MPITANPDPVLGDFKAEPGKVATKRPARGKKAAKANGAVHGKAWRLRKKPLAAELSISRVTLDEYLNRPTPPPPKPDKRGTYSVEEVATYIATNGIKAVSTEEMRRLRESLLRMDVEERAIELGVKKGQFIERAKIRPAIENVMGRLTVDLQGIMEDELPPKLVGKNVNEIRQIVASALDRVLTRMKDGWSDIS
jgi:hypothetical protein